MLGYYNRSVILTYIGLISAVVGCGAAVVVCGAVVVVPSASSAAKPNTGKSAIDTINSTTKLILMMMF